MRQCTHVVCLRCGNGVPLSASHEWKISYAICFRGAFPVGNIAAAPRGCWWGCSCDQLRGRACSQWAHRAPEKADCSAPLSLPCTIRQDLVLTHSYLLWARVTGTQTQRKATLGPSQFVCPFPRKRTYVSQRLDDITQTLWHSFLALKSDHVKKQKTY